MHRKRESILGCGSTSSIKPKTNRLTGALLLGSTVFLCAGEVTTVVSPDSLAPPREEKSFCDAYRNVGKLYSDENNPFIQSFSVFARFQYQYGYVDGKDADGSNFHYDTDEIRRHYAGAKMQLFRYFELSAQANIFDDDKPVDGSRGYEFEHLWDGFLKFDAGSAFGFDQLNAFEIGYGKREVNMSGEWNVSSKSIKTVERSAISNKIWAYDSEFSNPTGAWVELGVGNLDAQFGVFTTTQDDYIADWSDGELYYANLLYDLSETAGGDVADLRLTGFYQDSEVGEEILSGGLDWATSLSLTYGQGPWQVLVEGIYGVNGTQAVDRGGDFWGFVVLPSTWIIPEKLEAVARYQYQGSDEDQGVQLYSRYSRRAESVGDANLNGGRGDEHHSFYGGLNYYICSDNLKVMAGLQYDDMERAGGSIYEGWTTYVGVRTFF